jgi:hypothetical protein
MPTDVAEAIAPLDTELSEMVLVCVRSNKVKATASSSDSRGAMRWPAIWAAMS